MRIFTIIAFFSLFAALFSCKKDSPTPKAPIVQPVPQADGPGEYYGRIELKLNIDHTQQPLDSSVDASCRIYKTPVNSFTIFTDVWDSVLVNNYPVSHFDFGEYTYIGTTVVHPLNVCNNTNWTYYSQNTGYTTFTDNQPIGHMNSANSLSITISLSAPSNTISLGSIINCDYAIVNIGNNDKIITPSGNAKLVLYPEDYYFATPGPGYITRVELVSEKDAVYNGKKYHLVKRVTHTFPVNYVP